MSDQNQDTGHTPSGWKWLFLEALREQPNVSRAAELAGITRRHAYRVRDADPDFAAAWEDALAAAVDGLEAETFRRAKDGVDKPVFHKGEIVGHIKEYSDSLAALLLRAHRPERYRDRANSEDPDGKTYSGFDDSKV